MALNTAENRRSAIGISYHYYNPGVTPNGSQDKEWRQQSGHGYSAIAAGASVAVTKKRIRDGLSLVGFEDAGSSGLGGMGEF